MCKKAFSIYLFTHNLSNLYCFLSYAALHICFLTYLVDVPNSYEQAVWMALFWSARLPPWRPRFISRPGHIRMEMTLVKSLHSGDPVVLDSEYVDLQGPDVLASGRYWLMPCKCYSAYSLMQFLCVFMYVHVIHALGGVMSRSFSTGRADMYCVLNNY
jgi:hypothetical protein